MKYLALSAVLAVAPLVARAQQGLYTQCGGIGWGGGTSCVSGSVCTVLNSYYSQCLPGTATSSSSSHSSSSGTSSSPSSTPTSTLPRFGGVNTAGYDFSVATDGSFNGTGVSPPVSQYSHFTQEGANIYRIPFAWQLMTPTLGGTISQTFLSRYDTTVQAALNSGPNVYVILDLHNYARWNGGIIAQGGPTNAQFASIWTQLAQKYGSNQRVIFGLMNEPHDIPSLTTWAQSVQAVVTAIRQAGAQNFLLIPGSSYSSAQTLPTEAGPSLLNVTDPLGGTSRLIFDVHKYLDSDNSGTHPDCTTNNLQVFQTLVTWLQANGRQAILSETGGGNTTSCITMLGQQLSFIQSSYPTILGFTIWAAGAFDTTYVLTVTPNTNGSDQPLWAQAIKQYLP